MKILVAGANGQLGREMRIVSRDSRDAYVFTDVTEQPDVETERLDITDRESVRSFVATHGIGAVVNCAAYTNVDAAEDNAPLAELLNAKAVENLAVAMKESDGLLVHISTDYVFGGEPYNTPCREGQRGMPTGVYGETKLRGEEAIRVVGCRHLTIRTAWLYSEYGKNFVKTMRSLTSTKPQLRVVFDQTGTPTYALDLAQAVFDIVEGRKYEGKDGTYHYSNEGVCSWYDFTQAIARMSGHGGCEILPCHSDEFPSKVKRPAYSVLDKTKIKETFGVKIPYWVDSLEVCIRKLERQEQDLAAQASG